MGEHIIDGKFQSDKYPKTPRGLIPFKVTDPMAQPFLWAYAQLRRAIDAEFAEDVETLLREAGYEPSDCEHPRGAYLQLRGYGSLLWTCRACGDLGRWVTTGPEGPHMEWDGKPWRPALTAAPAVKPGGFCRACQRYETTEAHANELAQDARDDATPATEPTTGERYQRLAKRVLAKDFTEDDLQQVLAPGEPATEPVCGGKLGDPQNECKNWSAESVAEAPILAEECRTHGGKFQSAERAESGRRQQHIPSNPDHFAPGEG